MVWMVGVGMVVAAVGACGGRSDPSIGALPTGYLETLFTICPGAVHEERPGDRYDDPSADAVSRRVLSASEIARTCPRPGVVLESFVQLKFVESSREVVQFSVLVEFNATAPLASETERFVSALVAPWFRLVPTDKLLGMMRTPGSQRVASQGWAVETTTKLEGDKGSAQLVISLLAEP